jgi:guanylate kinase
VEHVIFAFVGPSGSGKSTLIAEMLRRFPGRLAVIKSVTTRPKRSAEDDMNYRFIGIEEGDALMDAGRLIQGVHYAGNFYGNDRKDVDDVFAAGKHGITALVEQGVVNFRAAGYRIAAIGILPSGRIDPRSEERRKLDAERARTAFAPDIEIENRFESGGIERAANAAAAYIGGFIDGIDDRSR